MMLIEHLRWDDVGPDEWAQIAEHVATGTACGGGCLSRRLRREGAAVLDVEVWPDAEQARVGVTALIETVRQAGVAAPPQEVSFALPEPYAIAYVQSARMPAHPAVASPAMPVVDQATLLAGAVDA
jgi:hypothetical protein